MEKLLLTEQDVCERLSLGRSTVRRLMAQGRLNPFRIGRALRFTASELERFVDECEANRQRPGG